MNENSIKELLSSKTDEEIQSLTIVNLLAECEEKYPTLKFQKEDVKQALYATKQELKDNYKQQQEEKRIEAKNQKEEERERKKKEREEVKRKKEEQNEHALRLIREVLGPRDISLNEVSGSVYIDGHKVNTRDYTLIKAECFKRDSECNVQLKMIKDCLYERSVENMFNPTKKSEFGEEEQAWFNTLEYDDEGVICKSLENVCSLFNKSPMFKGKFSFNELTSIESFEEQPLTDAIIADLRLSCENLLGYESRDKVDTAATYACHQRSFNPIKDVLESLVWDGVKRKDTYFIDIIGAEDTELNKSMTRKWFYALMKRLYEPGCKFDNMLIAYDSKQGTGKSGVVERISEALGLDYGYCNSCSCDLDNKDNVDKLNKAWIVGFDELDKVIKTNPEQTKQFLASRQDVARLAYDRRSSNFNRHCVFYGSTNIELFLKDYSSNFERRFWIMECHGEKHDKKWWDEKLSVEYIQQVLAEALHFYITNPDFYYTDLTPSEEEEQRIIQYKHKTLQNDEEILYDLDCVLNLTYDIDTFRTVEDFVAAIERTENRVVDIRFDNDNIDEVLGFGVPSEKYKKLDRIPTRILKGYLRYKFRRDLSTQYVSALLDGKWVKKAAMYEGKTVNCWVRI